MMHQTVHVNVHVKKEQLLCHFEKNMARKHVILTLTYLLSIKFAAGSEGADCASELNKAACADSWSGNEKSCSTCLQRSACCSWCKEPNYTKNRCSTLLELRQQNCLEDQILIGGASSVSNLKDLDLADTDGNQDAIQIKPQHIKIRLREGENVTFPFKYRAAKNYPIQLYYLMDLTNSMKAHKESLVKIGKDLGELLSNLTKHHQLAFGYYADKVAMPFYKMTPADVANPCGMLYGDTCSKGFAFVHAQDFTSDMNTFVSKVNNSRFTSNLDDLENGLEPIIQILQCDGHVSWLKTSRKMIVMATNSLLHMAGDGILAGVTRRHPPGGCILSADGILHDYLAYDYPSLEEVHRALEIKKVQLVLAGAVKSGKDNSNPVHEDYYRSLHNLMPDVSVFVNDRQIVENIKSGYEKITNKIYFRDNNNEKNYLDIKYRSSCNETVDTSAYCLDTNAGKEYEFYTTVHLSKLPAHNKMEDIILISESNIEESLEIHIEYIVNKECECADVVENDCTGHGTFQCGQCECDPPWRDTNCSKQCTIDNCRDTNETYTSTTCYSKGECNFDSCECECDDDASGKYCQSSNCAKNSLGRICSDNGKCIDGECQCASGFSGEICECSTSLRNCYKDKGEDADNVTICEGHGDCVCNKCVCRPDEEMVIDPETKENKTETLTYAGDYCQYCLNCTHTCSKYKSCITANVDNQMKDAYCDTSFPQQIEDKDREYGEDTCTSEYYNTNNQLCTISFVLLNNSIFYKNNGCSGVQTAGIFIYIPLAIIILGGLLAAFIWKVVTMQKDKIEWAKFEEDQKGNRFQMQSPLYKNPITRVENPLYPEKSDHTFS